MELSRAKVLVTGASTGIGAALAVALGRAGATLALVARRASLLDEVLEEARQAGAGTASRRFAADLADARTAERVALEAWDALDGLDAFVSNAAIPKRKRVTRLTADEVDHVMRVNFLSPVRMILAILPRMLERGRGTIALVGSITGRIPAAGESAYVASKYALSGFAETLACELAGTGVEARLLTLGPFDTPIWSAADNDTSSYQGPKNPPSLAADAILRALSGPGPFETFCPEGMRAIVEGKQRDLDAFIAQMSGNGAPREATVENLVAER